MQDSQTGITFRDFNSLFFGFSNPPTSPSPQPTRGVTGTYSLECIAAWFTPYRHVVPNGCPIEPHLPCILHHEQDQIHKSKINLSCVSHHEPTWENHAVRRTFSFFSGRATSFAGDLRLFHSAGIATFATINFGFRDGSQECIGRSS